MTDCARVAPQQPTRYENTTNRLEAKMVKLSHKPGLIDRLC